MESSTWNTLMEYYNLMLSIMIIPSITCSIIHIYKFFRSTSLQTLANKNITFYCSFLIVSNVHNIVMTLPLLSNEYSLLLGPTIRVYILGYLLSAMTIFKFVIAIDICLCFRKIALYLQQHSGSQNSKFYIYCILGTGIPLLETVFLPTIQQDIRILGYFAIIRMVRLVPIFGAFWYIRSASIDKKEFWTKFSLHMRLLLMIGGFSSVYSIAEVIIINFVIPNTTSNSLRIFMSLGTVGINNLGASLEGILIGVFFTFRKDTFKSVTS